MYPITGYQPTEPFYGSANSSGIFVVVYSAPAVSSIEYGVPPRFYLRVKRWCPPPPPADLVALPLPPATPTDRPRGTAWLARVARTPARERRAVRDRVERKDPRMEWS